MSTAGRALGLPLGREGRTLACQSAEQWASTSAAATATMFQGHVFRAALELVLARHFPDVNPWTLQLGARGRRLRRNAVQGSVTPEGSEASANRAKFVQYALDVLRHAQLAGRVTDEELRAVWEEVVPHAKLVGIFWTLRATLAGPLEALILADRLMFLHESVPSTDAPPQHEGVGPNLLGAVPVFHPNVSPRNMAIVASRTISSCGI